MNYLYFILLLCPASSVFANKHAPLRYFDIGISYSVLELMNNFGSMFSSFKEIFDFASSEKSPNIPVLSANEIPEDAGLNITSLAKKYGYEIEEHRVETADGYVLGVHRIPRGRNVSNGMVVFLMHGILDSSDSWLLQGPDKALGYLLADEGFDVWMGNARGNKHALSHKTLKSDDSEFWDFTFEEIGIYDLPAMIDYVLNKTKNSSLYYVGYSQGTTVSYVMNSKLPEYNKKIKMMFSLSPVAWVSHVKSPIIKMFSSVYQVWGFMSSNIDLFSPSQDFFTEISHLACTFLPVKCDNLLDLVIGSDYKYINASMMAIIDGHTPSGSSVLQFVHYGQLAHSGRFCEYDFGLERNLHIYGRTTPPDYDVTKITTPVILYSGAEDWLSDQRDVDTLRGHLPNVTGYHTIQDFNHLDYVYGSKAKEVIYEGIIEHIHDFEKENGSNILTNVIPNQQ